MAYCNFDRTVWESLYADTAIPINKILEPLLTELPNIVSAIHEEEVKLYREDFKKMFDIHKKGLQSSFPKPAKQFHK